jgi:2-(1,2-epoxy-1,2-dihydrophenyl)acetyl-CoA isomerase
MRSYDFLAVDRAEGIVTVALARPDKMNALNRPMWTELFDVLREVADHAGDRCLVLTGLGPNFSSGIDLDDPPELTKVDIIRDLVLALHELPTPTVAKVRGVAVGAAMNLVLACDLVVAAADARFSEIFIRRGLTPDCGGTWILPRLIGLRKAKELALLAPWVSGADAATMGLINRAVDDADVDGVVDEWAHALADGPLTATQATKRLLNHSSTSALREALEEEARAQVENATSPDFQEALAAFQERREPVFRRA